MLSASWEFVAAAESITLTPVADTSIFEAAPLNNLGAVQSLAAGSTARDEPFRALVKFDVSAVLPAGAVISAASLQLTVVRAPSGAQDGEFAVHRLLKDWGEGEKGIGNLIGTGDAATAGEASWDYRFFPTDAWSEGGGEAGKDYVAAPSTVALLANIEPLSFESSPQTIEDVQMWLDTPVANFGWMIKKQPESGTLTARRFGSREHPTDPPRLRIDYSVPFRIRSVETREGQICLRFLAQAGKAYVIEWRASADSGEWMLVANLPIAEATEEVVICRPIGAGNQFFRVGEQ